MTLELNAYPTILPMRQLWRELSTKLVVYQDNEIWTVLNRVKHK